MQGEGRSANKSGREEARAEGRKGMGMKTRKKPPGLASLKGWEEGGPRQGT